MLPVGVAIQNAQCDSQFEASDVVHEVMAILPTPTDAVTSSSKLLENSVEIEISSDLCLERVHKTLSSL